jgi:hypothetical protein
MITKVGPIEFRRNGPPGHLLKIYFQTGMRILLSKNVTIAILKQ